MKPLRSPSRSSRPLRLRIKENNLLDHPERSPHNRRIRRESQSLDRPGICRDTALMPWIIAESVCNEAANHLNSEIPLQYIDALDAKAERCYARAAPGTAKLQLGANRYKRFRQLIRQRDNTGRACLYAFMRHWLYAFLTRDHRRLALQLPPEFSTGHPIPKPAPSVSPRLRVSA